MRKTTLLVVFLILASTLLFTSCKPLGRAILPAVNPTDMSGFPRNVVKLDDTAKEIQVDIYATAGYLDVATDLLIQIQSDICTQLQAYNANCHLLTHNQIKNKIVDQQRVGDATRYEIAPKIVQSPTTSFIAIGTCGNTYVRNLLAANTCQEMFEHKALIQYINNNQLVITGGVIADIYAAVDTIDKRNLKGWYTDIINTENIIASSSLTANNEIVYTETFRFKPGINKINNPLIIPANMQTLENIFAGNLDKINTIYYYNSALPEKYQVYNAVPANNPAPSNLNHFAKEGETYIVDAKEAFTIEVTNAKHPDVTSLATAGVWGIGVQDSSAILATAGPYDASLAVTNAAVVNAFITGHSIADVTGAATAGMYICSPPNALPANQRMCGDTEVLQGVDERNSKDYYKFGEVSGMFDQSPFYFSDECIDTNTLREWYCGIDCAPLSETYTCPSDQYCSEGKCVQGTPPEPTTTQTSTDTTGDTPRARALYRCWDNRPGHQNHYLSFDPNCDGVQVDGLVGYVYTIQQDGTKAVYQCKIDPNLPITFVRYAPSFDEACEGLPVKDKTLLGYIPESATDKTNTWYRCQGGQIDFMVSTDIACEGYRNDGTQFYFLKTEPVPVVIPPKGLGEACMQKSECQAGLDCIENACSTPRLTTVTPPTTQNAKLVYRCYNPDTGDHSVSPCTGAYNQEHALGIIYTTEAYVLDTYPIRLCRAGDNDHFLSLNLYCEQQENIEFYGRVFNAPQGTDTVPVYRCYNGQDHMLSLDEECEGWGSNKIQEIYHFIRADVPIPEPTPTPSYCGDGIVNESAGEECDQGKPNAEQDCTANEYDAYYGACTNGSCVTCECRGSLDCTLCPQGSQDYCTYCTHCGDGSVNCGEQCDPPDGTTCDATCNTITGGGTLPPGVPPLVPPPTIPPGLPPLPHQFYGIVNNGTPLMPIVAVNQLVQHFTVVDPQGLYGYTPLFFVTGTTNGTTISWFVNNIFDQNYTSFQQGGLTRLDLTLQPTGAAPPTGPTCSDGIKNQNETDIDCGGPNCGNCANGLNCTSNADCKSNYCKNGVCTRRPLPAGGGGGGGGGGTGLWTAAEQFYATQQPVDIPSGAECFDDWICDPWEPCKDGIQTRECFLNDYPECTIQLEKPITQQACEMPEPEYVPPAEPTCFDGIKNQDETYRDCGGSRCKPCDPNLPCVIDRDCITGYCNTLTQTCGYPPAPVEEIPKPTSLWWVWLIVFLVALGGIGGIITAIILKQRKAAGLPNHRLEGLREYVDKFREKGVPEEKIRKKVESAGWKQEDIEKVFK